MKLSMKYVILYVNDFEKTIDFYKGILGLPIKFQQDTYVEFDTGAVTLSINTRKDVKELTGLNVPEGSIYTKAFQVGFVVQDVVATIETLASARGYNLKGTCYKAVGTNCGICSRPRRTLY